MLCVSLYCEKCHNLVGETFLNEQGVRCTRISIKIRGARRRTYIVERILFVHCDWCGHEGCPLPMALLNPLRNL